MATTSIVINNVVDQLSLLMTASAAELGGITGVFERAEDPQIAIKDNLVPCIYIVPMLEGEHHIDMTMGAIGSMEEHVIHNFTITLLAYYRMPDINTSLRTVRDYGYTALDVIKANQSIATAQIYSVDMEFGYFDVVDYLIHFWIMKLDMTAII
jgi:hypothetical protein